MADSPPDTGPIPLSLPAILRNPKLSDRFAHLRVTSEDPPQRRAKPDRPEPEGKRWVRRRENAKFTHNPHIAPPTTLDLAHPLQRPLSTFPHPLPSYLPRSVPIPSARPPPSLPHTSSAGLFSLSLRGARRTLHARPSSAYLVNAIETHLVAWLQGETYLNPDQAKDVLRFPGDPVSGREDVREVAREPGRLVWAVKPDPALADTGYHDGGFERYVVHCVARWYGIVSFSKDMDGHRLTYLLRPNVTRPDPRIDAASRTLDTPPTTDASDFHVSDASLSDLNTTDENTTDASDVDSVAGGLPTDARSLSDIEESRPCSPASWSVVGGSDFAVESDNDADDPGFAASLESLSLSAQDDVVTPSADTTLTPSRLRDAAITARVEQGEDTTPSRTRADRDHYHLATVHPRSTSSPSPARRRPHRLPTARPRRRRKAKNDKKGFAGAVGTDKGTFYDYLFA
ncbi:hypothetical protein L210DRAFT_848434 [Boletus edulis BED1]|uniref:R3H-associated N-terminal domain-containing protein n=1 Tax=Boletus edulis BED1 TaxID=1328754 RepID=A0AAD4BZL9_BOLED|nr:hypothetical protein L210DRAFT_848434 [Boletus edulis BED1]